MTMKLQEIMTQNPEVIRPDTKLQVAARTMRDLNVGMIPVCDGDRIQGMLTDRDITIRATAEGLDPSQVTVERVMTPDVVYCFEDQDVEEAAELMKKNQLRRLVVLDRDKRLTGIVSIGDIAVKCGRDRLSGDALEEVSQPAQPHR